jgi:hypothetical protein
MHLNPVLFVESSEFEDFGVLLRYSRITCCRGST